jgi:hypothetical protein
VSQIEPVYAISFSAGLSPNNLFCKCYTPDGREVWLSIKPDAGSFSLPCLYRKENAMNKTYIVLIFAVFAIVLLSRLIIGIYRAMDHWEPKTGETLKPDAVVTGISTTRGSSYLKTVVTFSDGFAYTSCDTKAKVRTGSTTYYVDEAVQKQILDHAAAKHRELLDDRS